MTNLIKKFKEGVSLIVLLLSFIAAVYVLNSSWATKGPDLTANNCMVWKNETIYCGTLSSIVKSDDDGISWKVINKNTNWCNVRRLFITKSGKIFYARDNEGALWRADTNDDTNWKQVLNSNPINGTFWGMAEDNEGSIYVGGYNLFSDAYCTQNALIWKSMDDGNTWNIVYNSSNNGIGNAIHIHFIGVDPYTDYVYAAQDSDGIGCGMKALIRSTDHAKTWTLLSNTTRSSYSTIQFTKDARILGEDAAFAGNASIVRTTDDQNFVPVLVLNGTMNANFYSSAKTNTGRLLFGTVVETDGNNASIWMSKDDGLTWQIATDFGAKKIWHGIFSISNPGKNGVNYIYEQ